jgi:signal transduction histidine kinase
MNDWRMKQPSLLWRVLLVTSAATVLLFSATAYLIARYAISNTEQSVEEEVQASLREFEFLWRTRADSLARSSRLLSTMSDVRGAFLTKDAATIRDTAADLWSRVSQEDAVFLVFDPLGGEIASLGGPAGRFRSMSPILSEAKRQFPNQAEGFLVEDGRLYYTILTPVYVTSGSGPALLNILATGFEINDRFAHSLARVTEGSDFVFTAGGRTVASTLASAPSGLESAHSLTHAWINGSEYAALTNPLLDLFGKPVGRLSVMRSLAASNRRFRELKNRIALILVVAIMVALLISYALARHIIDPIHRLDEAAAEVSRRNYGYRLAIDRDDELGRLARTFNAMCDSIQAARQELIAQERLNTIGRLSSSIVHDLRNPLAAIYGGAEMLADNETLPPQQSRRLALSIYRASRHIQSMLSDLAGSARGKAEPIETCRLFDIVDAARSLLGPTAENQGATITVDIPQEFELPLERSRMERVFLNLMSNSLEAMREGGELRVTAREEPQSYLIEIDDTGSGISEEARKQLFLPFFSQGKRNGLGLGLALSKQTVLDHGGELWAAEKREPGARFYMRLPLAPSAARSGSVQVA